MYFIFFVFIFSSYDIFYIVIPILFQNIQIRKGRLVISPFSFETRNYQFSGFRKIKCLFCIFSNSYISLTDFFYGFWCLRVLVGFYVTFEVEIYIKALFSVIKFLSHILIYNSVLRSLCIFCYRSFHIDFHIFVLFELRVQKCNFLILVSL